MSNGNEVVNTQTGEVEVITATAIESITKAEIDVAIATAHRFPRSITQFKKEALAMATHDEETAASCFYKLSRKGEEGVKFIEGPGIRLAEIIGSSWGNMRYGARIVSEDATFITAQGVAHDLERNVSSTLEVRRRITYKSGKRYTPDMIVVTANAACSIALRNAIFKVIPKVFVNSIYEEAKRVAIGDATTLIERRSKAIDHFKKMGVTVERLLSLLEKKGIEDVDLNDLETLTGLKTAIKDGEMTVDEAFPDPELKKSRTESLIDIVKKSSKLGLDLGQTAPGSSVQPDAKLQVTVNPVDVQVENNAPSSGTAPEEQKHRGRPRTQPEKKADDGLFESK